MFRHYDPRKTFPWVKLRSLNQHASKSVNPFDLRTIWSSEKKRKKLSCKYTLMGGDTPWAFAVNLSLTRLSIKHKIWPEEFPAVREKRPLPLKTSIAHTTLPYDDIVGSGILSLNDNKLCNLLACEGEQLIVHVHDLLLLLFWHLYSFLSAPLHVITIIFIHFPKLLFQRLYSILTD